MANKNQRRFTGGGRKTQGDRSRGELDARSQPGRDASSTEGTINKSELVHAAIGNFPGATPTHISKLLRKQGVDVSPTMVSQIKSQMRGGERYAEEQGHPKGDRGQGGTKSRPAERS